MAIYNTVMFFIERGSQIAALAQAVFNSIGNIAAGNVAGAANYVEQTMGRSLPVIISFLARLIGLGGVSDQIKNVIKKIQDRIENALNKLANFIVQKGKSLLGKGENNRNQDRNSKNEQKEETNKSKAVAKKVEFDWSKIRTKFQSKDRANHSIFVKVEGGQKIIMVASQEQRLIEFLVSVNGKINKTQNSKDKQRLIQNQTAAQETYQKALAKVNELKKLEQKGKLNDDQKQLKKELEVEIITLFNKLGENLKELGLGVSELNLTTKIQVDRQNSAGRTEQITADPLTPIPGNTKGSEPPRSQNTIPPGWDHLVNAKNLGVSNFNFGEWVRMHLIHEHLHGPGESYNLVLAPINVNTPAYTSVEKHAVETILKDPEAILWYQTTVEYYPEEPSKAYLSNFPKKITIKWFQYSVDGSGQLTKNPSSEVRSYVKDNIQKPPELYDTTTGTNTMYISNISQRNMRDIFGRIQGERLNKALPKASSLANLTVEELKTIYSKLKQESISDSSLGRDNKGFSEKNAEKDFEALQKIHGTQQDIDGINFTIDIKG
jgi:hypothetical protein